MDGQPFPGGRRKVHLWVQISCADESVRIAHLACRKSFRKLPGISVSDYGGNWQTSRRSLREVLQSLVRKGISNCCIMSTYWRFRRGIEAKGQLAYLFIRFDVVNYKKPDQRQEHGKRQAISSYQDPSVDPIQFHASVQSVLCSQNLDRGQIRTRDSACPPQILIISNAYNFTRQHSVSKSQPSYQTRFANILLRFIPSAVRTPKCSRVELRATNHCINFCLH